LEVRTVALAPAAIGLEDAPVTGAEAFFETPSVNTLIGLVEPLWLAVALLAAAADGLVLGFTGLATFVAYNRHSETEPPAS